MTTGKAFSLACVVFTLAALTSAYGQQEREDFLEAQHISSLAALPPVGEAVPASTRLAAGDLFVMKLRLRRAALRVVRAEELVTLLEQKGLMGEYANFVTLLAQTGIPNRESLKLVGEAAGTDGLLLIQVLDYEEQKGSWWYGRGGRNLARIQYTLFRTSDGEKVWESLEFRQHDSKLSTRSYPMERVIGDVSEKAVTSLLTGQQNRDVRAKKPK